MPLKTAKPSTNVQGVHKTQTAQKSQKDHKGQKGQKLQKVQKAQKSQKQLKERKSGKPRSKKTALRFCIKIAPNVIDEDVISMSSIEEYLKDHIKVNGKIHNLGRDVRITREKSSVVVSATIPFSKRYLKYLTKKLLKKYTLRDFLRIVATSKDSYELRFFNFETEDTDEDET